MITIKERRAKAAAAGRCSSCMKRGRAPGRKNCDFCVERTAKYRNETAAPDRRGDSEPIEVVYSDAPATTPAIRHCADPEHCSICMGVQPRRVVNVGGVLRIEGKVVVPRDLFEDAFAKHRERGRAVVRQKTHHMKRG